MASLSQAIRTQFSNNPPKLSVLTTRGATTKRRDKNCDRKSHDTILLKSRICFSDGWSPTDESSQFSDVGLPPPLPVILNFFPYIHIFLAAILYSFHVFSTSLSWSPLLFSLHICFPSMSCVLSKPHPCYLPSFLYSTVIQYMVPNVSIFAHGLVFSEDPTRKYNVIAWNPREHKCKVSACFFDNTY